MLKNGAFPKLKNGAQVLGNASAMQPPVSLVKVLVHITSLISVFLGGKFDAQTDTRN